MIGIVGIGYGDGYPRFIERDTPVLINGKRYPIVGRVSMDMICVDLGADCHADVGDDVVIWGESLPVEEIAQSASTIPYELICKVTGRVPRVMAHRHHG
jgi:alanine racemase